MHMYWIISIWTLISTPNVPICKFQYQSMSDHYGNHHLLIIMLITVCLIIIQITIYLIIMEIWVQLSKF